MKLHIHPHHTHHNLVETSERALNRKKAVWMAIMTLFVYVVCYFARNVLGVVQPQMLESTDFTVEMMGTVASVGMFCYAIGQLVCGVIGDYVKSKYMLGGGLFFAGLCSFVLPFTDNYWVMLISYALMSIFLSAIFGPLTKTIANNTAPRYVTRVALMTSIASIVSSPMAGITAMIFKWNYAFIFSASLQIIVGILTFVYFAVCEKKGWITYPPRAPRDKGSKPSFGEQWRLLRSHSIIQYTVFAAMVGIQNSVVYWIPTYFVQHLGFASETAAGIFTVVTFIKALAPFAFVLFLYEIVFKRTRVKQILLTAFGVSSVFYVLCLLINIPMLNVVLTTIALFFAGGYVSVVFSIYCPNLKKVGNVSSISGFINFSNYMVAALANFIISNIISKVGWSVILVAWAVLMFIGFCTALTLKKEKKAEKSEA